MVPPGLRTGYKVTDAEGLKWGFERQSRHVTHTAKQAIVPPQTQQKRRKDFFPLEERTGSLD